MPSDEPTVTETGSSDRSGGSPPVSLRTRRAVDDLIAGLRDEYGDFPVLTRTYPDDDDHFERGIDLFEAGHRGAAGARVTDDDGRLLCIRDPRMPETWTYPGGGHEPGESFAETARREVWEEAGVDCEVTGVWRALRQRFVCESGPQRRGYLLEVYFEAEAVGGEAGLYPGRWEDAADEEILAVEWFDEVPDPVAEVVVDPRGQVDRRYDG